MDCGDVSNKGIKRRLPVWMLGVAAADQAKAGNSKSKTCEDSTDDGRGQREEKDRGRKLGRKLPKSKAKALAHEKRDDSVDDLELVEEEEPSSLLVKCGERKRGKGVVNKDGEIEIKKKTRRGRAKKSLGIESSEEVDTGDCLENGEDEDEALTMEDLIVIAKEFVREEGKAGSQSKCQDVAQSGSCIAVPQANNKSIEVQEMSSSCVLTDNVASEGAGFKPSMSGNPTQDMLDLFLGPLLKKPCEEEKKIELIAEEMNFNFEAKKQNASVVLGEEPVTLTPTKKKSSLKDKHSVLKDASGKTKNTNEKAF